MSSSYFGGLSAQPNIVILMTDQQRTVQNFPSAWVTSNMRNLETLQNHGMTFTNAINGTCRCSPMRGMLWTSLYPPANGIMTTEPNESLQSQLKTLGDILGAGPFTAPLKNYDVCYQGKWHLDPAFVPVSAEAKPAKNVLAQESTTMTGYGWGRGSAAWNAPDAGTYLGEINTIGGGPASDHPFKPSELFPSDFPTTYDRVQNDARYTDQGVDFLKSRTTKDTNPFLLIVSLVNPHDVWAIDNPSILRAAYPEFPDVMNNAAATAWYLPHSNDFTDSTLPASYNASLSTKPVVQTQVLQAYGGKPDEAAALTYLKFYAYLNHLSDQLIGNLLHELAKVPGAENTIIIRIADHGEMAMAQGGMKEKDCNMYKETINVPLVFNNSTIWPQQQTNKAMVALVDLVPTVMSIAGLDPAREPYQNVNGKSVFQGTDFSKELLGTSDAPAIKLWTYDDGYDWLIRGIVTAPYSVPITANPGQNYINSYKYGVYYNSSENTYQYECYCLGDGSTSNLEADEVTSLLPVGGTPLITEAMHNDLFTALISLIGELDERGPNPPKLLPGKTAPAGGSTQGGLLPWPATSTPPASTPAFSGPYPLPPVSYD